MRNKTKSPDLLSAPIPKTMRDMTIPMIFGMVTLMLFNLVDTFFVSLLGTDPLAAISFTFPVTFTVISLAIGLSIGTSAIIAKALGAGNLEEARFDGAVALIVSALFVSVLAFIGYIFIDSIFSLLGAKEDLMPLIRDYICVWFIGSVFLITPMIGNAVLRASGDTKTPSMIMGFAGLINAVLDPIFIFGLGPIPAYGVEGAAIATTIGRGTAVVWQLIALFYGFSRIKIAVKDLVVKSAVMINLMKVSLGGIGQFLIGTSSWVFLMRIMSEFGSEVLAGYTIAIRIMMFTLMPAWGMSNAAATLVGQNLGAKKPDRAEQSVWKTGKYAAIFMGAVSIIYLIFAPTFLGWFTDNPVVVKNGSLCLRIIAAGYVFYAYGMVVIQSFNGSGDTKTPTLINFICFWLFQLPFAYLAAIYFDLGPMGVFLSITLAEVLIAVLGIYLFKKGKWKTVQV